MEPEPARPARPSVGWGIVGTGTIAERFASDVKHVAGAQLAAVTSRAFDKAAGFAARHGGTAYADLAAMLRDEGVGALYVASPNDAHFSAAAAALSVGKGVLIEKPLVTTSADAERLSSLATEHGAFLMEGMWTRFLPAIAFVRNALESGSIGEVRRVHGELAFAHPYDPGNRFFDAARGGGALLDLGVYLISLSLALLGRPDAADGRWRAAPSGVDMAAEIELTFGACRASLSCALDRNGSNLFVIEGARGTLMIQPPFIAARQVVEAGGTAAKLFANLSGRPSAARILAKLARTVPLPGLRRHLFDFAGHGLQFEIDAATRAIATGETGVPLAPVADAVETLRIIERVRSRRGS